MATNPHNRLGFHYFPDQAHYRAQDLQSWLPQLQSLGASWLVLRAGAEDAIPEAFVRGVIEAGIRPIVWIYAPVANLRAKQLASALNAYRRWGVEHVVAGDRPNLQQNWLANEWSRAALVERTVDRLLPVLKLQRAIGLRPVFPPLEPGGDYWDTAFLESAIRSLMRRGQHDLLRELSLAVYGWSYGRPLDWGIGGPDRWPDSAPYAQTDSSQDQRGIRLCDWYSAVANQTLGQSLPMLVVAGGALRGRAGPDFEQQYLQQTDALRRMLDSWEIPASVGCFAFYPLATAPSHRDEPFAWFDSPEHPRPIATAAFQQPQPGAGEARPLEHYVLLGEGSASALARGLTRLGALAMEQRAVIGFSSEQARMAKRVTIVGGEHAVPTWIEHGLRQHGCQVKRVTLSGEEAASEALPPTPDRTEP